MAATVNARDALIMSETRTQPVTLPSDINVSGTVTGDVTGTLNGFPVQDVINKAYEPSAGDVTKDILENSGTTILMTSSNLFKTGSGAGGVFIGAGGVFGKDSGGVTKFSINSTTGLLTAENATINGTLTAGSIITSSVTVDGVTLSTIKGNALTGSSHASSTGNVHNVNLGQITGDLDDIANGSTYFKTTSTQVTGAGRAYNALDSNNEYIKSLTSTKLSVVGANPSTGWVGDANGIRMYQGGALKVNIPVSGSPSFSGDITGGSNINITGQASFKGLTTAGGTSWAGAFNNGGSSSGGVYAIGTGASGIGVRGFTSEGIGVTGITNTGTGVSGLAALGGTGVSAQAGSGGVALRVIGPMTITSSALVTNLRAQTCVTADSASTATLWNQFGIATPANGSVASTFNGNTRPSGASGSSNVWLRFTHTNGTVYHIPAWI